MSLQRSPQDNPIPDIDDCFLHLKRIDLVFACKRPRYNLEFKLKHHSTSKHTSTTFHKTDALHWECDLYIRSRSETSLVVRKSGITQRWSKMVISCPLDFNTDEFRDDTVFKRLVGGITILLSFGKLEPCMRVTRLLVSKANLVLASKVSMLDKLDQVNGYLSLVLSLGNDIAQLHPVAQIVFSVVNKAFKRFQEIPACHHELINVMNDVTSMLPIMRLALDRVRDVEAKALIQDFLNTIRSLAEDCIKYSSVSSSELVIQNWFKPKTDYTNKLKDEAMRAKLNLGIALDVDIKGGVLNIQGRIDEIYQHQFSEADEKALKRLWPPEFSSCDPSRCCLSGTRASLIHDVQEWAVSTDQPSRLFWLYGVAGCGKSSIAASVASILESRKILAGSFFCKRDIPERRDPVRLVCALAYFLARASPPFRRVLLRVLRDDPTIPEKPLSAQFRALLADCIKETSQTAHSSPVTIVLDALDECDDNKAISSFLMRLIDIAPWLRLIVTSRPIPDIQYQTCTGMTTSRDLFTESADDDILAYARKQFEAGGSLIALRSYVTDAKIVALAQKASGLFIWITTVCSYISLRRIGKRDLLEQIISSTAAPDSEEQLDALYRRVLNGTTASGDVTTNKEAIRFIAGMIYVTSRNRPLPANALYAFVPADLGVLQEELDAILQDLGSVLTKDRQTNAIRVCHPSFLDFLGNPARSGEFCTETTKLDTLMTQKCCDIMSAALKFNICELGSSYFSNGAVADLRDRIDRCIPRELQYACLYWMNHLSGLGVDHARAESIWKMLYNLLCQTTALYWLEVLSLLSDLRQAVSILEKLIGMLKNLDGNADLYTYVADLYRFVKVFHEPMALSTPHIYISALLWAPFESIIVKSTGSSFSIRQCILEGRDAQWPSNLQTLTMNTVVNCVAFSPNGRHVASGCRDSTVWIWDTQTGGMVGEPLRGHDGNVNSVAYSPDGLCIVSGSDDRTVRVWDARTGAPVGKPLQGHDGQVTSTAYSHDGRHVASGSSDTTIRVWDVQTGERIGEPLRGHTAGVRSVVYSPDDRHLASGSDDGTVRIWDTLAGAPVGEPLQARNGPIFSIAYSADGRRICSLAFDRAVRFWDAQTGAQIGEPLQIDGGFPTSMAYSPDGRYVISGTYKAIRIWDVETHAEVREPLKGHGGNVRTLEYSSDGRHIVSGSDDKTIRIWDTEIVAQSDASLSYVSSLAYSSDGLQIVTGYCSASVRIWDAQTCTCVVGPLCGHRGTVLSVAFSPDRRYVVSGSCDKTICIWDARTGETIAGPIHGHDEDVYSVAYSPDGSKIVSGSVDATVRIWNAQTGAPVGEPLRGHEYIINSVAYSSDGLRIISGSSDKTIRIWNAQSGAPIGKPLRGHDGWVKSVAYSPDGLRIVSGSHDKTIRIWDARTGASVGEPFRGHDDEVRSAAYSPDGLRIVSGSFDNTIRVWDAQTGAQVGGQLRGHSEGVYAVACSPDGDHIASGSQDGTIRIWSARTEEPSGSSLHQHDRAITSPDGHCLVPTSKVSEVQAAALSNIPSSISNDGWIRGVDDGLLLWVPPEYRNGVCDTSLFCMPYNSPGHPVRIDWNALPHGIAWSSVKINRLEV